MRSSDFVNHSYDYRPNWTPLSPVTITYYYTLYSLSVFSLAESLQLILEISATKRLVRYLLPD